MNDNHAIDRAEFDAAVKQAASELIRDQMECLAATYALMLDLYQRFNVAPDPDRFLTMNDAIGREFTARMERNDQADPEVRREVMLEVVETVGQKFRHQFAPEAATT